MKKILSIIIIATLSLTLFSACEGLMASAEENYISVDYEKAGVQFVVDSNDEILSFSASNQEGEELLIDEDYIGSDLYEAIDDITSNAIELGYINPEAEEEDPNAILVAVEQFRNRTNNRYREQVRERLESVFVNKGVWALVLEAEDIEEIRSIAQEFGLSTAKARMIIAAQNMGIDISLDSIQDYTPQELAQIFKEMRPITAKIEDVEKEISDLQDELNSISEDEARYGEILTEIENLETKLQDYQETYDSIVAARELRRTENQARAQEHAREMQERANDIRQRKEQRDGFSQDVVNSKKARWSNISE